MRKARSAAKAAPRKTRVIAPRVLRVKTAVERISPDEVEHLESVAKRYEESEKAWQRLNAAPDEDPWNGVEEHLLAKRAEPADRRWKFFSK